MRYKHPVAARDFASCSSCSSRKGRFAASCPGPATTYLRPEQTFLIRQRRVLVACSSASCRLKHSCMRLRAQSSFEATQELSRDINELAVQASARQGDIGSSLPQDQKVAQGIQQIGPASQLSDNTQFRIEPPNSRSGVYCHISCELFQELIVMHGWLFGYHA